MALRASKPSPHWDEATEAVLQLVAEDGCRLVALKLSAATAAGCAAEVQLAVRALEDHNVEHVVAVGAAP